MLTRCSELLDCAVMDRNLTRMAAADLDLLVIGGGIHGACAAWDAASRGLAVALVDKDDFGAATSANSLKIVHGGLRYLKRAAFGSMKESLREQHALLRVAPHLVRPLPVLVATTQRITESRLAMGTAFRINDLVAVVFGSSCETSPRGRTVDRGECLSLFPWFSKEVTGGGLWHEAQIVNSERLTLSFLLSAALAGTELANHAEVVALLKNGRRVIGARVLDRMTGDEVEVRAQMVLNAAGPWAADVAELAVDRAVPLERRTAAMAVNVITRRRFGDTAVGIRSRRTLAQDPVGGGDRYLFLVPWRDWTIIGTSYRSFRGSPDRDGLTELDLLDLLADCNEACPELDLRLDDVSFYHRGLLPLHEGTTLAPATPLANRPRLIDHAREDGTDRLVSVVGVKYTTARMAAERAVDLVVRKLGRSAPCTTSRRPIWGGEECAPGASPSEFEPSVVQRLRDTYGNRWREVARRYANEPGWADPIEPGCPVLRCEIRRAVREEMALTLSDVVLRRTDLGTAEKPPRSQLLAVARIVAGELGWTEDRVSREIEQVSEAYRPVRACRQAV